MHDMVPEVMNDERFSFVVLHATEATPCFATRFET